MPGGAPRPLRRQVAADSESGLPTILPAGILIYLLSRDRMPPPLCGACGEPALQACSRCKSVYYCAPACQARDWSKHKGACRTAVAGAMDGASSAATTTTASRAAEPTSTETNEYGLCAAECGKPAVMRCSGCLGAFFADQSARSACGSNTRSSAKRPRKR